tara:strand:- start:25 stop:339 length:315 start_codon:yes stop_codon:yes gene_type:complete
MNRYSENYIMTAHVESAGDMLELQTIRKTVKVINKTNKWKEHWHDYRLRNIEEPLKLPRYRVKCQGRGPRASVAREQGRHPRSYDRSLPLALCERMDVYVYERT